jgi:hypothetical protein
MNNTTYSGTLTISGSTASGTNTRTFTINLNSAPDLVDIMFNGPVYTGDPRSSGAWFKNGVIGVPTNNAGGGNPSAWVISSKVSGSTIVVTATYSQQFVTAETLTATNFSYKIVDYSVFD